MTHNFDESSGARAPWLGLSRDPVTVLGMRRVADDFGHPLRCREKRCRRFGKCRAPLRADPRIPALVLPRCLSRQLAELCFKEIDAMIGFRDFEKPLAALRERDPAANERGAPARPARAAKRSRGKLSPENALD